MKKKFMSILICLTLVITAFAIAPLNVSAATEEDIELSILDGVAWLVAQQNTNLADPNFGSWNAYGGQLEAGTGLALYKLCDRAYELDYESPFDPAYAYHQNVIDGFNWLFNHLFIINLSLQDHTAGATGTIDDPDTNGNGIGVCGTGSYSTYNTGILLAAIASSLTFDRVVNDLSSPVNGWTYGQIAQDMVDYLAYAQVDPSVDPAGFTVEGGWDYYPVNNGAGGSGWQGDQSNSGYAVLGLGEAQDFGCIIPDWVKTELNWWIDWVQDDVDGDTNDGGSWYSYPGDGIGVNILKTGNLIFQMSFIGDTEDTQRVIDATDYMVVHWNDASGVNQPPGWNGTPAEYQAMFCAMKGLTYININTFDSIDWFEDFSDVIVAQQDKTPGPTYGSWQSGAGRGGPVILTEWALLTLERVAPIPVIDVYVDIKPGSCPNPINLKDKGVLPVAICSTEDEFFDATTIDPTTIRLTREGYEDVGVSPLRWSYEDVATPYTGEEECGCHDLNGDDYLDLTLKFKSQDVINALNLSAEIGNTIPLIITGNLKEEFDGSLIRGQDCVWILANKPMTLLTRYPILRLLLSYLKF